MATGKGQVEMWPPTWRTVATGQKVWVRYTHSQWMRATVLAVNDRHCKVVVDAGLMSRELNVAWNDVRWHPPADALIAEVRA